MYVSTCIDIYIFIRVYILTYIYLYKYINMHIGREDHTSCHKRLWGGGWALI